MTIFDWCCPPVDTIFAVLGFPLLLTLLLRSWELKQSIYKTEGLWDILLQSRVLLCVLFCLCAVDYNHTLLRQQQSKGLNSDRFHCDRSTENLNSNASAVSLISNFHHLCFYSFVSLSMTFWLNFPLQQAALKSTIMQHNLTTKKLANEQSKQLVKHSGIF